MRWKSITSSTHSLTSALGLLVVTSWVNIDVQTICSDCGRNNIKGSTMYPTSLETVIKCLCLHYYAPMSPETMSAIRSHRRWNPNSNP